LEVLDEVIQNTQSHDIINAVRRIGKEKEIDDNLLEIIIKQAECWFD
jgi:hypothetical protein